MITDPVELREADVLIVAVKTYDMAAALASVGHLKVAMALSIQNGVLKNVQLADVFGAEPTVGAATFLSGEVLPDGAVRCNAHQILYVGELPAGSSARVQHVVAALTGAGLQAEATAHMQTIEWSKFAAWIGGMVLAVLTRLETYKFLSDPDTALVCARLMRETAALATTWGIALTDMPAFAVHTMTSGTEADAVAHLQSAGSARAGPRPPAADVKPARSGARTPAGDRRNLRVCGHAGRHCGLGGAHGGYVLPPHSWPRSMHAAHSR